MQVIVVGGGISGLVCAYRLHSAGVRVLLLEKSSRLGGVIETVRQDGFQFELGPQSFLSNQVLLELVSSLGLEADLVQADSRAPRFIYLGGRLIQAPLAPPQLIASPLLSARTKFRLFTEPFRRTTPPDGDESVASFVRRKFGEDLLENLVGPLVSGIHAGDPDRLSLRSAFPFIFQWEKQYGSVLKGAVKSRPAKGAPRPALSSFRDGVSVLVRALGKALEEHIWMEAEVQSLRPARVNGSSSLEVSVLRGDQSHKLIANAVVLATDTLSAARILCQAVPAVEELFRQIEYAAVATVGGGYEREKIRHPVDGFGFLVPRKEGFRILGTVWNSSLFPGRAPEGMVNLTTFVGGATDQNIAFAPEKEILEQAEREVAQILGISGPPLTRVIRLWPRALPQYNLGHASVIAGIRREIQRIPGLFLAGNYLSGASIGYCSEQALSTAEEVRRFLFGEKS